jgi:hypothetical protein
MIGFLIPGWLKRAALALAGLALALLGARWSGKREGLSQARSEAQQKDAKNARKIEDKADAARRRADTDKRPVDERLRELEGFRDD